MVTSTCLELFTSFCTNTDFELNVDNLAIREVGVFIVQTSMLLMTTLFSEIVQNTDALQLGATFNG